MKKHNQTFTVMDKIFGNSKNIHLINKVELSISNFKICSREATQFANYIKNDKILKKDYLI